MDPDTLLDLIYKLAASEPSDLGDLMRDLDKWLTTGGFFPKRWNKRPIWTVYFEWRGNKVLTAHDSKEACYKQACENIYAIRMWSRGTTYAQKVMTLMSEKKWEEAATLWHKHNAPAVLEVVQTVTTSVDQINFTAKKDAVLPHPTF